MQRMYTQASDVDFHSEHGKDAVIFLYSPTEPFCFTCSIYRLCVYDGVAESCLSAEELSGELVYSSFLNCMSLVSAKKQREMYGVKLAR